MSISSSRLKTLTECVIGEGESKQMFGRNWEELYNVISEEEDGLTEEMFNDVLSQCRFKNPERIGLIALICPPLCTFITDRVMGKTMREIYKFFLYVWYFMFIMGLIQSLMEWKLSNSLPLVLLCMVVTSWSIRGWSKDYNKLELIYNTLKKVGKI